MRIQVKVLKGDLENVEVLYICRQYPNCLYVYHVFFQIPKHFTVKDVKLILYERTKIEVQNQILLYKGKSLSGKIIRMVRNRE